MEQKKKMQHRGFCGTYEIILDHGCFNLPEAFLEKLEAESPESKMLCFYPYDVLFLFSEQKILSLMDEALRYRDQLAARRIRYLISTSMAAWSSKGAISIPAWLIERYEFSESERITLFGMENRIELWKADAWHRQVEEWNNDLEAYRDSIMKDLLGIDE
ncbi:hypothetical protein LJC63_02030 [Ruminococcaceae bacterium OttesenSCG-928-L11]|nr:hypothetical protein [Ruminococcaceae bacterium OttesenSCG-928-L11]